jgi:hypothetical protein
MRQVTQQEYDTALAASAVYRDFCKPYVQKNGWTVIPPDAPKPTFNGAVLDINVHSTNIELFELQRDKPEKFSAYVQEPTAPQRDQTNFLALRRSTVTTWTGEPIGEVVLTGVWHVNNFGGKWRQLAIRTDWNMIYTGREYDSRQFVNFRRQKGD